MAFVMLRNVRNNASLSPSISRIITSRCFNLNYRAVDTQTSRLLPSNTTEYFSGNTKNQLLSRIVQSAFITVRNNNVHAAATEAVGDSKSLSKLDQENGQPTNLRVSRFKRKASFLQHLKEKLETGKTHV